MLRRHFTLVFLASMVLPGFAAQTIVGKWAGSKAECKSAPVVIKPLEFTSPANDTFCYFKKVKRTGDRVTWTGHCFTDGGSRRPETGEDGEVVATLGKSGVLNIAGLGFALKDLRRC